jgi:hypothetical protein
MALALVPTIFQRPFEVNEECPAPIWNIEHGAPSILDIRQVARVYAELIGWLCWRLSTNWRLWRGVRSIRFAPLIELESQPRIFFKSSVDFRGVASSSY